MLLLAAVLGVACLPARPVVGPARPDLIRPPLAPIVAPDAGLRVLRGPIPFPFEANVGQADDGVAYLLRAGDLQAAFGAGGVTYQLLGQDPAESPSDDPLACRTVQRSALTADETCRPLRGYRVNLELVGAQPVAPTGTVPADTVTTYLVGSADEHHHDVPSYLQLAYRDAWAGIDVLYERSERGLKSTYVVAPGAEPKSIRLDWHGVTDARLDESGALVLATPLGELREGAPVAWQEGASDGHREMVAARWQAAEPGPDGEPTWGFALGAFDPGRPLVIDPDLSYGTYLGGGANDQGTGVAADGNGSAHVTGTTSSSPFGFGGAPGFDQVLTGGQDVFVVKLAPNGQSLVYGTYLGGNDSEIGHGIAVDGAGAAYVTGETFSNVAWFGAAPGFNQVFGGGNRDAFVVKLAANGQSLVYGTYLGDTGGDEGHGIAVDGSGSAYVVGYTESISFTLGAGGGFDQTYNGGQSDAWAVKLTPDGLNTVYGTYLGGNDQETARSVAVDGSGAAYVTGDTQSANFGFGGASGFDQSYNGNSDGFVVKLAPNGLALSYGTFLGGSGGEQSFGIAVDGSGSAYVAGITSSDPFGFGGAPGFDQSFGGPTDGFVVKLATNGQSLVYGTYLGGSTGFDGAQGVAVDSRGAAYVAGATQSSDFGFGNAPGFRQTYGGGNFDTFAVKLAPGGQALLYGTFLGGANDDSGQGIAVDGNGVAYVAGLTNSDPFGFGTAPGFDRTYGGGGSNDAFVVKDAMPSATPTFTPTPTATSTGTPTSTPTATQSPTTTGTPTSTPTGTLTITPTATQTSTPTATATVTPAATSTATAVTAELQVAGKEEKSGSPHKRTETQRQQDDHTNRYGLDQYRTEGNVIAVEHTDTGLVITLGLGRGETLDVVFECQNRCPSVSVGNYVTVTGEAGDDGRFLADTVTVER
jgi:hypothetical protein